MQPFSFRPSNQLRLNKIVVVIHRQIWHFLPASAAEPVKVLPMHMPQHLMIAARAVSHGFNLLKSRRAHVYNLTL